MSDWRTETWEGFSVNRPQGGVYQMWHLTMRYETGHVMQKRESRPTNPQMGGWLPDVLCRALTTALRNMGDWHDD
jgi:hypothetical protein